VAEDLTEDLLGSVDQPLKTCKDPECGKEFLLCDYNRDADFYRSPYTNKYYDPEDPAAEVDESEFEKPSEELRRYEEAANEVFDMYRER
jgi:capping protein beta